MTIAQAITELTQVLGDRLTTSKSDLDLHGQSEAYFPPTPPDAVAYPRSTEEVSQIMRICSAHDCPVVAWGTGTSLEGHALAINGGICVDFTKMDKILRVSPEDMDCTVQPGVTREALNTDLRATGLFFPVDPGANASLGGMTSTRASGTTAVRYGTMRDNVMGLEVVLADGRVIRTGTRARKSSSGYDLTALFTGAEGTLGLITEITLRLRGQPEAISAAVCAFDSTEDAVNAVITTIQMGIPMARIEFLDKASAAVCKAQSGIELAEAPHLLVEFHGSETSTAEDATRFGEVAEEFGGTDFRWSSKPEERSALWEMRHRAYWSTLAAHPGCTGVTTDACVPISQLARAIEDARKLIDDSPVPGYILGHVGDGNYHSLLIIDPNKPEDKAAAKALAKRMSEQALELQGTITGEHGIGMGKLPLMAEQHGDAWSVMGDLKRTLDPQNILNPGKVVQQNG
ncbi:FAD-binding protein [Alphaproteobacteria bacterium KMM 3653]|uniref:D-lactate dehydrogenase (cytochrome) n=1 Tax=Harenicola maris TaxID=2841044 RepID=A0AAP2CMK0_9RHOB|nr:FAD-binding protein [Harenicola maris]